MESSSQTAIRWSSLYLSNLLNFEWKQTRSPAGPIQWIPTADLALKFDPAYKKIAERFLADLEEYCLAFAKAWYKLTHRDMGPPRNFLGNDVPKDIHI